MKYQPRNKNNNIKNDYEEVEENYIPEYEIEISDLNTFNQEVLKEINELRENPQKYAEKLENILEIILKSKDIKEEKYLFLENIPFIYNDLYGSLNDSIKFLKSQKKLSHLKEVKTISENSCGILVNGFTENPNYKNSDKEFENRIKEIGKSFGENYEIINFYIFDPEFLIINLILSDAEKTKFTRKALFNPNIKYIGISSGFILPNKMCIIINLCEEFFDKNNNIDENKFKGKKNIYSSKKIIYNITSFEKAIKEKEEEKKKKEYYK